MNQVPGVTTKDFTLEGVMPALTKRAVAYVSDPARSKQPFFLYMPLSAPHLPIVPNKEYEGKSKAGRYGDFVVEMDACVGRVLNALDTAGLTSNTLIFFSSDNGGLWHWWEPRESDDKERGRITPRGKYVKDFGHQGNGPLLRGTKADSWEGGHRVPLIVRWPGKVKAGTVSDRLVCLIDLLATTAEISGVRLPRDAGEDSVSMLPALLHDKPARTEVVLHTVQGQFAIRSGDWVLIESRGSGGFSAPQTLQPKPGEATGQLYDLRRDISQTRNVWNEHPDVVATLSAALNRVRSR
jgi:arylsulfatase A-like enzyme